MTAPTVGFTVQFKCLDMAPEGEPPVLWAIIDRLSPEQYRAMEGVEGRNALLLARGKERQIIWVDDEMLVAIEAQPLGEFHWTGWKDNDGHYVEG